MYHSTLTLLCTCTFINYPYRPSLNYRTFFFEIVSFIQQTLTFPRDLVFELFPLLLMDQDNSVNTDVVTRYMGWMAEVCNPVGAGYFLFATVSIPNRGPHTFLSSG